MDWEEAWNRYWQQIYIYVYYKVRNRQEAEDLTQDTFIRLIRSGKTYEGTHLEATLKRTAYRLIIDRWRRAKAEGAKLPILDAVLGDDGRGDPQLVVAESEEVLEALDALNTEQRKVVELRVLLGYSVKETAELMGKTESAIKTLLFRAIRNIQKKWGLDPIQGGGTTV